MQVPAVFAVRPFVVELADALYVLQEELRTERLIREHEERNALLRAAAALTPPAPEA